MAGVITSAARVAVEDTFLGGKLVACHERAKQIAGLWEGYGGKLTNATETNMVWLDLEAAGVSVEEFIDLGQKAGVRVWGGRLVVHYQIGEEAVRRLEAVMQAVFQGKELEGRVEFDAKELRNATSLYG